MKQFWDQRYACSEYIYGTMPNVYFKNIIDGKHPGSILMPSEGEGRNAVYAAALGWQVHAFDYSEEARKKALSLARNRGVEIQYEIVDAKHFKATRNFDLVALIFAHFDPGVRKDLVDQFIASLNSGGSLIGEVFSKKQLGRKSGGPKKLDLLYSVEELKSYFAALRMVQCEEMAVELDEGPFHRGMAQVIRFVATKA